MFKITVVYGADLEIKESDTPITIGQIRRDEDLRGSLGYGDNINLLINGVAMPDEAIVPNGSTVTLETAANKKAVESELVLA
jgi:hypothetical protein